MDRLRRHRKIFTCGLVGVVAGFVIAVNGAFAAGGSVGHCAALPDWATLHAALKSVAPDASGLQLNMWATVINRDGIVCAVAFTGPNRGAQWPGSRVISAQKANTANAFSLSGLALATANLYFAVQPGGSLFGLQESNPVDAAVAYADPASSFGLAGDPMVGHRIGGVNVFGGGLALYNSNGTLVGGVGVSGDTSCTDHVVAWNLRHALGLDHLAGLFPVSGDAARPDNMVQDIVFTSAPSQPADPGHVTGAANSLSGFGHPTCLNNPNLSALPAVQ